MRPRRITNPCPSVRQLNRDAALRFGDERQEAHDLGIGMKLVPRPLQGLTDVELGLEEQSIGALELGLDVLWKAAPVEPHRVEPEELDRVPGSFDERRDVLL